jgi:hypothetical protein
MATFQQRNVQTILIGGTAAKSTGGLDTLNVGEIGIFNPAGQRLTEASAATEKRFFLAQGRVGGTYPHVITDVVEKDKILSITRKLFVPATEQLEFIGFNGTSGAIDVINDNLYTLTIYYEELLRSSTDGRYNKVASYTSDLNATQQEIANGVAKSVNEQFARETERVLKAHVLCDNAGSAPTYSLTVTEGSAVAITSAASGLAAGDVVRIGVLGSGTTTLTDDCYTVVSVSGTQVTFDRPLMVASGTYAAAELAVIPAATAATANFGIKLVGQPLDFQVGKIQYKKSMWTSVQKGFGSTPFLQAAGGTVGSGTYEQVAELEWFTQGNEGEIYRMGEPAIHSATIRRDADPNVAGGGYALINIEFESVHVVGFQPEHAPKLITLAIPATTPAYADAATPDDITDVLEVLAFGSTNGSLAL